MGRLKPCVDPEAAQEILLSRGPSPAGPLSGVDELPEFVGGEVAARTEARVHQSS